MKITLFKGCVAKKKSQYNVTMSLTKQEVFRLSVQFLDLMHAIVPSSEIYCGLYKSQDDPSRHNLEKKARTVALANDISSSSASLVIYSGTHNSFKTEGGRATAIVHEQEYAKYVVTAILLSAVLICCLVIIHSRCTH